MRQRSPRAAQASALRFRATACADHGRARCTEPVEALQRPRPSAGAGFAERRRPRRQIVGHHAPGRPRADDPTQSIKDLAQRVVALRGVFGHEGQGRSDEGPLLVAHIAWIGFACHAESIPRLSPRCITGSSICSQI